MVYKQNSSEEFDDNLFCYICQHSYWTTLIKFNNIIILLCSYKNPHPLRTRFALHCHDMRTTFLPCTLRYIPPLHLHLITEQISARITWGPTADKIRSSFYDSFSAKVALVYVSCLSVVLPHRTQSVTYNFIVLSDKTLSYNMQIYKLRLGFLCTFYVAVK